MVDYTVLYWRRSARGQVGEGLLFCLVFGDVEVVAQRLVWREFFAFAWAAI